MSILYDHGSQKNKKKMKKLPHTLGGVLQKKYFGNAPEEGKTDDKGENILGVGE